MERLLILNPGSTSTKLAVFDGEEPLFVESITHSAEELAPSTAWPTSMNSAASWCWTA